MVVPLSELLQTTARMTRVVVQAPVDLLGLQGLVEPLQKTELGGRSVLNPNVCEVISDRTDEATGGERRPVVGHEEGRSFQRAVNALALILDSIDIHVVFR